MSDARPPAVILGGGATAVPIIRHLSDQGIEVIALGKEGDPGRWSRFGRFFALEAGDNVQRHWLDWLEESAPPDAIVLAASDHGVELIARHRTRLEERGLRAMELNDEAALAMLDKQRTYEIADRASIPAPRSLPLESEADVELALATLRYPFALKPIHSHLFHRHFRDKLLRVADDDEFRQAFARTSELGLAMLATEVIEGPDGNICTYCTYLDENSNPLGEFTKRRPRQFPAHHGTGTLHVSDWIPDAVELGRRFCEAAELRGLASVEFKRDERDGELKLIECNYRFLNSTPNLVGSGFDIITVAYNRLAGLPLPSLEYRRGLHTLNPLDDFRAFLEYRRDGDLKTHEWLRSVLHRPTNFTVWRWDDPGPTLGWHRDRARNVTRRLIQRAARR